MATILIAIVIMILLPVMMGLWWRRAAQSRSLPCPWWLAWLLETSYTETIAGTSSTIERLDLYPALKVLDVGCGPGRLTIPAAKKIGPSGFVAAVDIQPRMLQMLQQKVSRDGLTNVRTILGSIDQVDLGQSIFDRALLVTVLGEIPNQKSALSAIYAALKPGGILSITEIFPDPHYQSRKKVRRLAESQGFQIQRQYGNWLAFTLNFVKPSADGR